MKILHTSDIHIGRNLSYINLLDDQKFFLDNLLQTIKNENVDILLISGDIYNNSIPSAASINVLDDFLREAILELKIKVLMIAGNHDSPERLKFSSNILEKSGLYISSDLKDGLKQVVFNNGEKTISISLLPFFNPASIKEDLNMDDISSFNDAALAVYEKLIKGNIPYDLNILMAHGFFTDPKGKKLNLVESETNVGGSDAIDINIFKEFDYIALGHLHSPQKSGTNGFYCGSPLKYSLAEINHTKQLTLLDIDEENKINLKQIKIKPLHDVKLIEGNYDDIIKNPTDDYVFIKLSNKQFIINGMANLKPYFPNCIDLQYPNLIKNNSKVIDIKNEISPYDVFCDFYSNMTDEKMSKDEEELIKKIIKDIENENTKS